MDFDDPIQTVGSHGDITVQSDAESVSSVASSISFSRRRGNKRRKKKNLSVTQKTHNVSKQKDIFGPKLSTREFQHILRDESKAAVELLSRKHLLSELLQKDEIEQEMMTCLLSILVALSGSWNKDVQDVFSFLAELNFIEVHLLHYTIQWRLCPCKDTNTARKVITVLRAFRRCVLPSSSNASLVVAVIHDALRFEKILIDARQLQECLGTCRELMSSKLIHPTCEMRAEDEPPSSIFPRAGEVVDPRTKAQHLPQGEPASVSKYLDIHYKLRREDIVDPLRKVIAKYHSVKRSKGVAQAIRECRVYTGVHQHEVIISPTSRGITIRVQIDVSHLVNVNWETTKILSFGSLVCLTSNHFHSMAFATVAKRDHSLLKKGFLDLQFMRYEDVIALITGKQFFMVDTQYYCEETYKVLEALQGTISDCLPLAHHLVYLSAGLERPNHLKKGDSVKYDIGPLVKSESGIRASLPRTWTVPVLEPEKWPSVEHLNVDEHQLNAIQRALSQEVTVITGHPGTGKSYTGLKIAQLLLLNKHRLASSTGAYSNERADGPLLFICSEKAALDEFLAGVATFQRFGIVRCGDAHGRKALQQYNLEKYQEKHAEDISSKDDICINRLEKCKERIDTIKANIEHLRKSILPDEVLQSVIEPSVYNSFIERSTAGSAVLDWLLQSDVSESDLQCLKEDGSWRAARFTTCENKDEDEWLEDKLPFAFSLEAAHLQLDTRNKLSKKLARNDGLTASDLKQVSDVWSLNPTERWQLYHTWLKDIEHRATKRLKIVCEDMDAVSTESQKLHDEVDARIFREAALIGMTASSAVKHRRALHNANPAIVIFSEAADILQSTTVAVLPPGIQQLILIGDRLPVYNNSSSVQELAERQNASASVIQHFIKNDYAVCNLRMQHRMSPTVSKLSRLMSGEDYQSHQSVVNLPDVNGIERNIFFIDHINEESPANHEASFLLALFDYLINLGYSRKQISIITTFPAQLHLFQNSNVIGRVFAIDGFRGDSDIVLFMSNGSDKISLKPGCIQKEQRLPFILTRARIGLYVIGNFSFLSKQCPVWERLLQEALRLEWVDTRLNITCPHHPNNPTAVSSVEDFKRRSEGNGCGLSCQARLDCGHCCKEVCHDHDLNKASVICSQPCNRDICKYGHKCMKLCSEPCERKCKGKTEKELPCGHQQLLPCYLSVEKAKCRDKCERLLRCGHKCTGICGERCKEEKCTERTTKTDWPCKHTVEVPCSSGPDTCPEPCGVVLACGHMCSGTCGKCHRGRIHIVCEQPCGRTLVCGHSCESNCAAQCPPCSRRCENKCQHSDCRKLCGEPCIPCRENCLWRCPHLSCQNLCGEPCKRAPCDEPCPKTLPCGHNCIGMCGEKCPTKCRVCNMAEVTEILFGGEDEEDARFVELEDCGHVIEVEALDHYMNMNQEGEDAINIQMKGCPKCKTPIRRNLRYGDVIKQALKDVENVKVKIRGTQSEIDQKRREMQKKMAELRRHAAYRGNFIREEDFVKISEGLKTMPHLEKVLARVNRCAFLCAVADIWDKSRLTSSSLIGALSVRQKDLQKCLNELADEILGGDLDRFTEQQMNDFQQEISRLDLRAHVITLLQRNMPSLLKLLQCSAVTSFDALVNQATPFTKDDEKQAKDIVLRIQQSVGCVVLGISDKERVEIVRAIGLSQGHWYKCPQGHVYAIGECGGAMQQAKCPECGAAIGGQSHSLTSGNRVASEMDGAQQAAWPTGQDENEDVAYQAPGMEFDHQDIEEQFEIERQIMEDRERERQRERECQRERVRQLERQRLLAYQCEQARQRDHRLRVERERVERERVERERMERERVERQRQQERRRELERQLQYERYRLEQERVERERVEELARAERNSRSEKNNENCVIS